MEKSELLAEVKALNLPRGLIVRSLDGRSFFLTEEEIHRKAVTAEANAAIAAIFKKAGGGAVAALDNEEYCAAGLKWLLTHEPLDERWRRFSAAWIEEC